MKNHLHLLADPVAGVLCLAAALKPALGQTSRFWPEHADAVIQSVDGVPTLRALEDSATRPPPVTTEAGRNREIVRRAFSASANGHNVFDALLANDIVWTIYGSDPIAGTYHNKKDFVERASTPLVSRLRTAIEPGVHAIWADGDTVVVRFDGSATTTSGASLPQPVCPGPQDGKRGRHARRGVSRPHRLSKSHRKRRAEPTVVAASFLPRHKFKELT